MPSTGTRLYTSLLSLECPCNVGVLYSRARGENESERLRLCQSHTQELEPSLSESAGLSGCAHIQADRARSKGEEVVLPGQKPCPPSQGAASSPGLRDICPASRPQTAAQSHVSTSTRESGNWLRPLRRKEEGCGLPPIPPSPPPRMAFQRGEPTQLSRNGGI